MIRIDEVTIITTIRLDGGAVLITIIMIAKIVLI